MIDKTYTVPARLGRAVRLNARETIRIANPHGTQVCHTWIFNAEHLNEFLLFESTRAYLDKVVAGPGDPLVTNQRRPIAELVADTSPGVRDTLIAACDLYPYRNLGVEGLSRQLRGQLPACARGKCCSRSTCG